VGVLMASQSHLDEVYMGTAILHSRLSKAKRAKVGAILVTKESVCLTGFNGPPRGMSNDCEIVQKDGSLVTSNETIHSELNCVIKAAREGISVLDSTIYVTLSPCISCSALLIQAGVKRVVYLEEYRDKTGIDLLKSARIQVEKFNDKKGT
jgi:dCMP deaminase